MFYITQKSHKKLANILFNIFQLLSLVDKKGLAFVNNLKIKQKTKLKNYKKQISYPHLTPAPNVKNLFTLRIYKCSYEARVFVPGKPFQPSLLFACKARSLP